MSKNRTPANRRPDPESELDSSTATAEAIESKPLRSVEEILEESLDGRSDIEGETEDENPSGPRAEQTEETETEEEPIAAESR